MYQKNNSAKKKWGIKKKKDLHGTRLHVRAIVHADVCVCVRVFVSA